MKNNVTFSPKVDFLINNACYAAIRYPKYPTIFSANLPKSANFSFFITCPLSMNKIIPVYIAFAGIKAASLGGGPSQLSGVPSFWV